VLNDAQDDLAQAIVLGMRGTFFNAAMSAALYTVLKRVQERHKVYLHKERDARVENILLRNGFFPHLTGASEAYDTYGTTIRFKVFQRKDEDFFYDYTNRYVIHHPSFPVASKALKEEIHRGLLELFVNASTHADSRHGIFTCGQLFPNKNTLEFCLADAGIGIHGNVRKLEPNISDVDAIVWAMQEGNTTRIRTDGVPGGLGLKVLKEFIQHNGGRLIMVSGLGYLEINASGPNTLTLDCPFPGTVAHLAVRTDDPCYYALSYEATMEKDLS